MCLNVFDHNERFTACYICFLFKLYLNSIRRKRSHAHVKHPADITVMFQNLMVKEMNGNAEKIFKGTVQHFGKLYLITFFADS